MPKWFQSGDSNSPIFVQCLVTYQVGELRLFNFFNFEFFCWTYLLRHYQYGYY